jgi:tetrahydromethanopterin S-methyltransferase subunit C
MEVSRQQLQGLLARCGPHAGSEAAADVLQRLADYGLGVIPLRAWSRGLFSQVCCNYVATFSVPCVACGRMACIACAVLACVV